MIPEDLSEVFGVLSVGILAVSISLVFYWLLMGTRFSFRDWITKLGLRPEGNVEALMFVLVAYALGLIVGDITDHLTDTDSEYSWGTPMALQQSFLGKESSLRMKTLVRLDSEKKQWKLRALGRELFSNHTAAIKQIIGTNTVAKRRFAAEPIAFLNDKKTNYDSRGEIASESESSSDYDSTRLFQRYTNQLYYDFKNWAYREVGNHFRELESIQRRIDFTRSCFLLASWSLFVLVPILIIGLIWLDRIHQGIAKIHDSEVAPSTRRKQVLRITILSGSLILTCVITRLGYIHAEEVFNERAFGYRVSSLRATVLYPPPPSPFLPNKNR